MMPLPDIFFPVHARLIISPSAYFLIFIIPLISLVPRISQLTGSSMGAFSSHGYMDRI